MKEDIRRGGAPISFVYGGARFPAGFALRREPDADVYTHADGLEVAVRYEMRGDSDAVEWVVWFTNRGGEDSALILDAEALDAALPCAGECVLAGTTGTQGRIDDFRYFRRTVAPGGGETLASDGSEAYIPFANVECGGAGAIVALGWTGHWHLTCARGADTVRVTAGMSGCRFLLHPGEHVRSPRVLWLAWTGDPLDAHNALRRHLVRHHIPKGADGEPTPGICCSAWGGMTAKHHLAQIDFVVQNRLPYDIYWIDAGWYGGDHETSEFEELDWRDWAYKIGDWRVNHNAYPNGLGEVADAAHAAGMKLLVWCSAFQCVRGVGWQAEHPGWGLLDEPSTLGSRKGAVTQTARMYLDDPDAAAYLARTIRAVLRESRADYLREDTPKPMGHPDEPGREGVGEMKAVEAFYAYWDALRAETPDLVIDNCGGGGRRLDLETIGRSYCFWRSDYNCFPGSDPIGAQSGNYGLGFFLPLAAGAARTADFDTYAFRSGLNGGMPFHVIKPNTDVGDTLDVPVEWYRAMMEQFAAVRPCLSGDFYPLTGCDLREDSRMAYQLDRPDRGVGAIFAFRRQKCASARLELRPRLPEGRRYLVRDLDTGAERPFTGGDTLTVTIGTMPGSALLLYREAK